MTVDGSSILDNSSSPREIFLWRMFKATLAAAAWTAAILALISLYQDTADSVGYDFYEFWVGGDVLRNSDVAGPGQRVVLYSDAAFRDVGTQYQAIARTKSLRQREAASLRQTLDNPYTPFCCWVFSVFTAGDYDRMFHAYRLASLGFLFAGIWCVGWRLRYSIAGIGVAVALAASSGAAYSEFNVLNTNCPQLAASVVYLLLRDRARRPSTYSWLFQGAAGLLIGLLVAFKPNLLLVPLLIGFSGLVSGRWRAAMIETAGLGIGLTGAAAVSSWRFGGWSCWYDWARVIDKVGSQLSMPSGYGNIALSRTLYELTGHNFFAPLAVLFMALAVLAIWLGRDRIRRRAPKGTAWQDAAFDRERRDAEFRHDLTLLGIAETMTFMISGRAWLHYPILTFPFLMLMASGRGTTPAALGPKIVRCGLAAIVILLQLIPPSKQIQSLLSLPMVAPLTWVRCTQTAILVSFGIGLWFESRLLQRRGSWLSEKPPGDNVA